MGIISNQHDRVLFVSVHPDDETFGCGGTIFKHQALGTHIYWLNLTGISTNHPYGYSSEFVNQVYEITQKVAAEYRFEDFINLDFPTMLLDTVPYYELVNRIDKAITELKPNIIYIPNRSDVHTDHQIGFKAIYSCTKSFRKAYIKQILMYETLSETEFAPATQENVFCPNHFEDVSEYWEAKMAVIRLYEMETMPEPLPRSIRAVNSLGALRGSRIGANFAEAYTILFSMS